MERLDVLADIINNKSFEPNTNITLTTIHSSKGLEWNNVYMIDVIDWIFPEFIPKKMNMMTEEERKLWEEERRLFYVGMTRAKQGLYIYDIFRDSVFINELRDNLKKRAEKERRAKKKADKNDNTYYSFEDFIEMLEEGIIIKHNKYGRGRIIGVDKNNISVMFDGAIVKNTFNIRAVYSLNAISFE